MYFDSFSQALHMDGHGVYVWTVCAVAVVVIGALLILPSRREKATLKQIAGELRRQRGPGSQ